jgi:hypothetical protein
MTPHCIQYESLMQLYKLPPVSQNEFNFTVATHRRPPSSAATRKVPALTEIDLL